ncbi:hypothetical protein AVEN_15999-1, partial [Araneus ventricosus]
ASFKAPRKLRCWRCQSSGLTEKPLEGGVKHPFLPGLVLSLKYPLGCPGGSVIDEFSPSPPVEDCWAARVGSAGL